MRVRYREWAVPTELRPFVALLWSLESEPGDRVSASERILPDCVAELVLHFGAPFEQRFVRGELELQPRSFVVTLASSALDIRPSSAATSGFVAVRFRPGGFAPFVDVSQRELADRSVALADIFGRDVAAVEDELDAACDPAARFATVVAFLRTRRLGRRADDVSPIVRRVLDTHGQLGMRALAADLGWSERRVQRVFLERVGSTPKQYARLVRFHAACRMIRGTNLPFAQVAAECGYFDQAHLVHDVREFAGETPSQLRARDAVAGD